MRNNIQLNSTAIRETANNVQTLVIPPRGKQFKNAKILAEKFVILRDDDYYMRQFCDGSCEFVRFDDSANKWVFLCFPAA